MTPNVLKISHWYNKLVECEIGELMSVSENVVNHGSAVAYVHARPCLVLNNIFKLCIDFGI